MPERTPKTAVQAYRLAVKVNGAIIASAITMLLFILLVLNNTFSCDGVLQWNKIYFP
jgi:hypothetical protein